jgi:co-chaperonin GroES (HSP10)
MPVPVGYKLLCALPEIEDVSKGGIVLTPQTTADERTASQVLEVLALGPQAYTDTERYSAPWCAKGDYILVRPFAGVRVMVGGKEFRLLNEDMVEAVLPDPSVVTSL